MLPSDVGEPGRWRTAGQAYAGRLLAFLLLLLATSGAQAQTTANKIYWVQSSGTAADDRLASANLDGTGQTALASGASNFDNPNALWVDAANNIIYVGDGATTATTGIRTFSLTGTLLSTIVPGTSGAGINAVQVVGNKIYWVQSSGTAALDQVASANLDGTNRTTLISDNSATTFNNPQSLWVDAANNVIYVGDGANTGNTGISRFTLSGTYLNTIVAGVAGISINGLQVVGNKLYWVQSSGTAADDRLVSANLDGTGVTVLASGNSATTFNNPQSLRVDVPNSVIYVGDGANTGNTGISRFTLTGTYISTVVAGGVYSFNGIGNNSVAASAPTVTTTAAASITSTSAILGGNVTADGGATVTERGVVYSTTNTTPTTSDTKDTNGTGTGTFSETIGGLTAGTTYYVRAYAINSVGTSYGSVVSFTTPPNAPVVTAPANGSLLATTTPAYSGTATANSTVTVYVDGSAIGTTTATAGGTFSLTQPTALTQGSHTVFARASINGSAQSANSNTNSFVVDTTQPNVAISSTATSPTSTSPIPVTVTFSEPVTGFVQGDVTVGNGTISGFTGSGASYSFNVTPTANGTVTVNVPANVAQDAAGNFNTAATQFSITYTAPTATVVSITRLLPSPTATTQVSYRVVFSGNVSGLTTSNFSVTSSTGASVSSVSGSGASYTVVVNTGTGNGTLTLNVQNSAGISPTVTNVPYTLGETYTITKSFAAAPTLRIQAAGSASGNSDVTAFVDVVQVFSGGSPVANALQNGSFESNNVGASSFLYQSQGVVASPWTFGGAFSGVSRNNSAFGSTAFSGDAVLLLQSTNGDNNASASQNLAVPTGSYQVGFQAIQRNYTARDQRLNVFVNDVFVGSIQPNNIPTYDAFTSAAFSVTAPALTATISSTATSPTNTSPIPVTVTFSASVTGFVAGDVTVTGGTISGFTGSGTTYTFNVTPSANGTVTVNVPANVAVDANNTGNSAATQFSIVYQQLVTAVPVVTVPANGSLVSTSTPTYGGTAPANSTVQVYVDGVALPSTTTANGSGNWSIAQPTALSQGSHTVYATAQSNGQAVSANSNTNTFTVDSVRPAVAISSSAGANGSTTGTSPIPFSVTFSENVTGFVTGDITVTGGTISGFSGTSPGATFTFNVTPSANGTVTVNVPANVAQDAAGNGNTAATQFSIIYSQTVTATPVVTAPANGSLLNTATPAYSGTAVATATVTVYVDGISIGTTTASAGGSWTFTQPTALAQGSHTVYATAQLNGQAVSANSNTNTFIVDSVRPAVAISSSAGASGTTTSTSPLPFTVTFTESVTGFVAGDVSVSNGTISGFAGSGATYTFNVTPSANGTLTVDVPANVAVDAAGNGNTAATQFTFIYSQPVTPAPVVAEPANGSLVNNNRPIYGGTAAASSTVTVYVDGSAVGTTTTNSSGIWGLIQPTPLTQGSHTVYATAQLSGLAVSVNSNTNTFTVDTFPPTVVLSASGLTNGATTSTSPVLFSVSFSESVTGFVAGAVSVSNGTISNFAGSGLNYSFNVTPSANGTVTVNVPANVAQDQAGNGNTAATPFSFIYSQTVTAAPVVVVPANGSFVSTSTPTYGGTAPANSTVQVYVDGVALPSTTTANGSGNWSIAQPSALSQGSHTVYATAQLSGQAVSANSNTNTFTVDSVRPAVAISSSASNPTSTSPIPVSVTFSESVTGFVTGDVTVTGGTISGFSGSGANYSFNVTPSANGTVTVNVPANVSQDQAGNGNTAAPAYSVTFQAPTIAVNPATLPSGTQGTGYSQTLTASGGTAPYSFAVTAGALPTGLTLTTGGTLAGTPIVNGTFNFTVTATDNSAAPGPFSGSRSYSLVIAVPVVTATTWTGSNSSDWFTAVNWTSGVPTTSVDATIPTSPSGGRFPSLTTATANARNLTINSGARLTQTSGTLVLAGNLSNNGTFQPTGGTVNLGSTALISIAGSGTTRFWNLTIEANGALLATSAGAAVQRVLTLNGNFNTNGNPFTLESDATGTAMVINNNGATVIGQATMQRYIDPSRNTGLGYRHYSSPVQTTTVADLTTSGFSPVVNPDYNTQGNTVNPFPTVYGYDQARIVGTNATTQNFDYGYFSPSSLGDNLVRGRGYTVNIAASEKVDLIGTLNSGTVPVGSLSFGTEANSGWHLLGNPYPAPLDWNKARTNLPAGVIDAIYVYKSSTQYGGIYQFYQNGFGTLPNGTVPAMAGFFLRVNQPVASFNFQDAWRSTSYDSPVFNRPAADTRPALQLDLVSAQGVHDPAYVYFEEGATAGLDDHYDAEKLPNTTGLNLASVAVGKGLAVNGLPLLTTSTLVPLTVGVPVTGTYTLQAASLANFGTTSIYLRDAVTGQQIDLQQQSSYTFSASNAALITDRFSLSFGAVRPLGVGSNALAASVTLYPNPARKTAWIELPAALGRKPVTVSMLDAVGREVRKEVLPALGATAHALSLQELPVGVYLLRLSTEAGTITKRLIIE
ncbi:Ig-like domain-containing protein [Hymenobacter aquaticus]|nr:Ig-like domain-containing protein [Hymenobacter aquaticus]